MEIDHSSHFGDLPALILFLPALHLSACEGNSKIAEFILLPMSKGDPNVTDRWGVSPLLDAIKHGCVDI